MSSSDTYRAPFESPSEKLIKWRHFVRWIRNGLIAGVVFSLFVALAGLPYLRWEYRYHGSHSHPYITDATYLGFGGRLEIQANEYAEGCPLVLFIKLGESP